MGNGLGEVLLDLVTDNLHRAVHKAILLGKWLIGQGNNRWHPSIGELAGIDTAIAILCNLGGNNLRCLPATCLTRNASIVEQTVEVIARCHDKSYGIWVLVVVDHNLVDIWRLIDHSLLHTLGTILLAIARDEQTLEAAQHIEEVIFGHIAHITRMQPAIAHRIGRRVGILPVASHHILATNDNLALLANREFAALVIQNLDIERLHQTTRRAKAMIALRRCICRDYGRCLRETIALEHWDAYSVEEALQLAIEKRTTTDEELQLATKCLAHLRVENLVE